MKLAKRILWFCAPALMLFGFLMFTSPDEVPLVSLLVPYSLIFWLSYNIFGLMFSISTKKVDSSAVSNRNNLTIRAFVIFASLAVTLFFVLQSINQLTLRDGLIMLGLMAVTLFYVRRSS